MYINTVGDCKKYLLVKHNFLEGEFGISNETKTKIRFTKAMLMHRQHFFQMKVPEAHAPY